VYEKSVTDYFKIMRERKAAGILDVKPVMRKPDEQTGTNMMIFESNQCRFGICDCNNSKLVDTKMLTDDGFAPNNGDSIVFGNIIAMATGLSNSAIGGARGGYKSREIMFSDGMAFVHIDLVPFGTVRYKLDDKSYVPLPQLIRNIAVQLAIESTDEGGAAARAILKERFENAEIQRQKFYGK